VFRASLLGVLLFAMSCVVMSGCKNEPDPRDSPDFNHESASDPGSIMKNLSPPKKR
jgi:hypothetical protein